MRRNLGDAGAAIESPGVASRRGLVAGLLKSNRAEDFYHDPNDQLKPSLREEAISVLVEAGLFFRGAWRVSSEAYILPAEGLVGGLLWRYR
jgi:hypothetical protein